MGATASAGEQRRAAVLCMRFSPIFCNFGSWHGEIVPAGVDAPGEGRRLRHLTMRNHLNKPEVSPGACNGERRRAEACGGALHEFFTYFLQFWQLAL